MNQALFQEFVEKFYDFLIYKNEENGIKSYIVERKKKNLFQKIIDAGESKYRIDLLKYLFRTFDTVILKYSENPNTEPLIGSWNTNNDNYFSLESKNDIDFYKLLRWMGLGDWKLFFTNQNSIGVLKQIKNEKKLLGNFTGLILDSFADNIEWTIFLKRESPMR